MPVTILWLEDDQSISCCALDIDEEESYSWPTTVTTHPIETGGVITDQVVLGNPKLVVSGYITNKPGPNNYMLYGALLEGLAEDETAKGTFKPSELTIKNQKEYDFKQIELKVPGKKLRPNAAALVEAGFNALFGDTPTAQNRIVTVVKEKKQSVMSWSLDVGGEDPGKARIKALIDALIKLREERRRVSAMGDLVTLHNCIVSDLQVPRKVEDGEGAQISITFEQIKTVFAKDTEAPTASPGLQKAKEAGSKAAEYSENYEAEKDKILASHVYGQANGF